MMPGARLTRYQQLAEELADGIRAGALRPGERLPSVRKLLLSLRKATS